LGVAQHRISVVIPVYRGAETLPKLLEELAVLVRPFEVGSGMTAEVAEVLLVDDCGPDGSHQVIRSLEKKYDFVRPVWLMRNYGQHAATIAGLASSRHDWVVTIDEDGLHDPRDIRSLLERALIERQALVYGRSAEKEPHSKVRNAASSALKRLVVPVLLGSDRSFYFSSFRLMTGEVARSVAAFANQGVYLDIALRWLVQDSGIAEVRFRRERRDRSGYKLSTLASHFLRLVVSAGARPLRIASVAGLLSALVGFVLVAVVIVQRLAGDVPIRGWSSLMAVFLVIGGLILVMLGVLAEYMGAVVRRSLGAPLYVIGGSPRGGTTLEQ
jgi:glycosyltransferase involved in cell wall biosynthesis